LTNSPIKNIDARYKVQDKCFTPTLILPPQIGGGELEKDGFPFSWE